MNEELKRMFDALAGGDAVYLPSRFWEKLNRKNIEQLESGGLDNFKRTVSLNYFTWFLGILDPQFLYLLRHTPVRTCPTILRGLLDYYEPSVMTRKQQIVLSLFTRMLWRLAESVDDCRLLQSIEEPPEGNPFRFLLDGKRISQDLANSVLEFYSMREHFRPPAGTGVTICELGAGYGRNAYLFLKAMPGCRYVVIDIPPALYVSQHYLSSVFPERNIFRFRNFGAYSEIGTEFEAADIAFLLPHQADLLPGKTADLFVNISSLHEMRMEQIEAYLKMIGRMTRGYFYSKQWMESRNPEDGIVIRCGDYPIPRSWTRLFLRKPKVQTHFFEAMYAVGSEGAP